MKRSTSRMALLFLLSVMFLSGGCTFQAGPARPEPLETDIPLPTDVIEPDEPLDLAEIEKRVGFDVQEPAYLPEGVYFDLATYQEAPHPDVTLQFNLVHEQYGDVGRFFQITQEPRTGALSDPSACGVDGQDCETMNIGELLVSYRLNKSAENPGADTELLLWENGGFSFQLFRMSGEPNKIYKDELLKVVGSMK